MSETMIYAMLFAATFPALWLLAWWLDRVWPSNWEMRAGQAKDANRTRQHKSS